MLISVWGSFGSGKSLFSTVMGKLLADAGKRTLIIYSNISSNDTICFYPAEKEIVSMADLWQSDLEDDEMFSLMMTTASENLAYLSYAPGENIYSYPVFTKYNIVSTLARLGSFFDYIIVDCASDLNASVITMTALEMSEKVVRLMGANGKDSLFFMANLPLISDSRYNLENHICVLSDVKNGEPSEIYERNYGNISYRLLREPKIYVAYMEGSIFKVGKNSYIETVAKIIKENISGEVGKTAKKVKSKKGKVTKNTRQLEDKKIKSGGLLGGLFKRKEEEELDGKYDE